MVLNKMKTSIKFTRESPRLVSVEKVERHGVTPSVLMIIATLNEEERIAFAQRGLGRFSRARNEES